MTQDKWSEWILQKRFGGDAEAAEEGLRFLRRVRDLVLDSADLQSGQTVLDVGAGDGLIAFGQRLAASLSEQSIGSGPHERDSSLCSE